ncbi:hypothetical protein QQS21_009650 [Conoideocrella luteorostrata]|uniref:Phenol 2-monooxygenase n=1 Tax=Conoideocrella luteorostrata TaxID=1105319 RepID=A0AAJ0CGL7_9HYPO|nr:hypothetical protein QQS21_009650 [Conoideocrella luteorostrata]
MSQIISALVDVLIVGAGPAGLTAANCFNGTKLKVLVVDKKDGPEKTGRADGLKSISLEILDTFGIGDTILTDSQRCEEIVLWNPDKNGVIQRTMTIADKVDELMKPREITLDQGRIEAVMGENLQKHGNVETCWNTQPVDVELDPELEDDPDAYPITVNLHNNKTHTRRTICAKYLIGSDGGRSWLRKFFNIKFTGDLTDSTWGVLNMIPRTDFPDIRKVFVVHSTRGTIMGVPREDKLVRFYISMDGGHRNTSLDAKSITSDKIVRAAQDILAPYKLEAGKIPWWSAYCVGQRVADQFSYRNRVFLAGDAVHTHSPKAGQGMNTSIQDGYNIGWKLRYYLENSCNVSLVATYESERRPVAQALINFDKEYLEFFARTDTTHDEFLEAYLAAQKFTTGIGIRYAPSVVVQATARPEDSHAIAAGLAHGMRLPDFQMVNQSDGVPVHIYHRLTQQARFRLLFFPGDIANESTGLRFKTLGSWIAEHKKKVTGIEFITIHSSIRADVELMNLHPVFRPWDDDDGWDYWAVYADDESYHDGHGHAYERCGIDRSTGCMVLLRPDGYVSLICGLDDTNALVTFLDQLNSPSTPTQAHEGKYVVQANGSLKTGPKQVCPQILRDSCSVQTYNAL